MIYPADQDTTAHTTELRNYHGGQLHGRSAPVGCVHSVPEPQRVAHPVACKYEYIGQPGFDHRVKAEVFIRSARIARRFLLADEVAYDQRIGGCRLRLEAAPVESTARLISNVCFRVLMPPDILPKKSRPVPQTRFKSGMGQTS